MVNLDRWFKSQEKDGVQYWFWTWTSGDALMTPTVYTSFPIVFRFGLCFLGDMIWPKEIKESKFHMSRDN